jgi:Fe-S oxidoreductase
MSTLKAEFLHQYYQTNGIPLRAKAFAYINEFNRIGSIFPHLYNFLLTNPLLTRFTKKILGIASERTLPTIHKYSLRKWYRKHYKYKSSENGTVYLFCDEFTNWNDTPIGIKSIQLLQALKYDVKLVEHPESGRAAISKGLLLRAKKMANANIRIFQHLIDETTPLLGVEPSAILSFKDEYPKLVDESNIEAAKNISQHSYMIEEFLAREAKRGKISSEDFLKEEKNILIHGHCHQKSLGNIEDTIWILSLPEHHHVSLIPSGKGTF